MLNEGEIKEALTIIRTDRQAYKHFFSLNDDPEWIEPLYQAGFFVNPPDITRGEGYIEIPAWPESEYLARMAVYSPERVKDILLNLPFSNNARVYMDMADAALQMPVSLGVQFVPVLVDALARLEHLLILPDKATPLVFKLMAEGEADKWNPLLFELLKLKAISPKKIEVDDDMESEWRIELQPIVLPRSDEYLFVEITRRLVRNENEKNIRPILTTLMRIYDFYYRVAIKVDKESDIRLAMSRPKVEKSRKGAAERWLHSLIDAIVATASQYRDHFSLGEIVEKLLARDRLLYTRIAFHLMSVSPDVDSHLLRHLANAKYFECKGIRREYQMLARVGFGKLSLEDRRAILLLVDKEYDPEAIRSFYLDWDENLSSEELDERVGKWRRRELAPFVEGLFGPYREEYERLVANFGEYVHYECDEDDVITRWGSVSPLTDEELDAMSVEDVVTFLLEWQPTENGFEAPTVEGMASKLRQQVLKRPEEFAAKARLLAGAGLEYCSSVLSSLTQAARDGKKVSEESSIWLCARILEHVEDVSNSGSQVGDARKLESIAIDVAHFIIAILSNDEVAPEMAEREALWALIQGLERLASREDGSAEEGARDGWSISVLGLNSLQGTMVESVIVYLLWCRRQESKQSGGGWNNDAGLKMLEKHLNSGVASSLGTRSVYGRFAPWLLYLDREWFLTHRGQIFDERPEGSLLWRASWEAYVVYCNPYKDMLEVLATEYRRAITEADQMTSRDGGFDPVEGLGIHILSFYAWGLAELDEESIVFSYLTKVSSDDRGNSLRRLGLQLRDNDAVLDAVVQERFMRLWEFLMQLEDAGGADPRHDLVAYGWWFAAGVFPVAWSVEFLEKAIKGSNGFKRSFLAISKLAEISPEFPDETLAVLEALYEKDPFRIEFAGNGESVRTIVRSALQSGHSARASIFLNKLVASGFTSYRDLAKFGNSGA